MKWKVAIGVGLLILICGVFYLFEGFFRFPPVSRPLYELLPNEPLGYLQGIRLNTHVKEIQHSWYYRTIEQSMDMARRQAFWDSKVLDPMRLIGREVLVSVHTEPRGEGMPGLLIMSKVDPLARVAERLVYAWARLSGQFDLRFVGKIEGVSVYVVQLQEMDVPVYYSLLGDVALGSTSFPLLQESLARSFTDASPQGTAAASLGLKSLQHIPENRVVTSFWDLSRIADEGARLSREGHLSLFHKDIATRLAGSPPLLLSCDADADNFRVTSQLLASDQVKGSGEEDLIGETHRGMIVKEAVEDSTQPFEQYPCISLIFPENMEILRRALEKWFFTPVSHPSWQWNSLLDRSVECRLSDKMLGTLFPVPDISCVAESAEMDPDSALAFLNSRTRMLIEQLLPSRSQRALVSLTRLPFQETFLTSVRFAFQEIFAFAALPVIPRHQKSSLVTSLFFATNRGVLTSRIKAAGMDRLGEKPTFPDTFLPVLVCWIQTQPLADFLDKFSQTSTVGVFVQQWDDELSSVLSALRLLPPVMMHLGVQRGNPFLRIQLQEQKTQLN